MILERINKVALWIVDTSVVCLIVYAICASLGFWGLLALALFFGFFLFVLWAAVWGIEAKYGEFDRMSRKEKPKQLPTSPKLLPCK